MASKKFLLASFAELEVLLRKTDACSVSVPFLCTSVMSLFFFQLFLQHLYWVQQLPALRRGAEMSTVVVHFTEYTGISQRCPKISLIMPQRLFWEAITSLPFLLESSSI